MRRIRKPVQKVLQAGTRLFTYQSLALTLAGKWTLGRLTSRSKKHQENSRKMKAVEIQASQIFQAEKHPASEVFL